MKENMNRREQQFQGLEGQWQQECSNAYTRMNQCRDEFSAQGFELGTLRHRLESAEREAQQ
eukprot:2437173-Amphidinium_carterae.1